MDYPNWFIKYAKFMVIFSHIMSDLLLLLITILWFLAVYFAVRMGYKIIKELL